MRRRVSFQASEIVQELFRQERNLHQLPGKANVVADALIRKAESMCSLKFLPVMERPLAMDVQALDNRFVRLDISEPSGVLACVVAQSSFLERIKAHHFDDPHLLVLKDTVQRGGAKEIVIGDDGGKRLQGHICGPNLDGLRELIFEKAYSLRYSIHPGVKKMYCGLKQHYWWRRMKKDIVPYVSW
ncbi:uncharacterized protein [Nicotiana tomentosiformis]|uniref:uncharacterized protein n=1 Tax=Nicotiana tomentosiformis TaxID=4098 RepID=UPI00388C7DA6